MRTWCVASIASCNGCAVTMPKSGPICRSPPEISNCPSRTSSSVRGASHAAGILGDGECLATTCAAKTGQCEKLAATAGKACDADGSVCTPDDGCKDGACAAGVVKNCDDGNACTDDSCDAKLGCKKVSNAAGCDDGNACTANDACGLGSCSGAPKNVQAACDDNNACTSEGCDPKVGCVHSANKLQCEDGNPCTLGDVCAAKVCVAGTNTCGRHGIACAQRSTCHLSFAKPTNSAAHLPRPALPSLLGNGMIFNQITRTGSRGSWRTSRLRLCR